ncbi:DEAD/DEAH box helicase family protein [Helicobacter sp. 12S02634-8]|uniref:DEAD/DEAH box helicase family protein n=1 Tax=Helicobacter sp. 12S02634-8 TaxID=1476199 RepID=UPI0026945ADA
MIFEEQAYQQECIRNIIEVLRGFDFKKHDKQTLKDSLNQFYHSPEGQNIPLKEMSDKLNLDILMETGTGKTFTYLNLIFALNQAYKQNKFIIFVPRKAILESIKQNISLTKEYFYHQYKKHLKAYYYSDKTSISNIINHYIKNSDELSILLLTNSSIDKSDKNLLHKPSEALCSSSLLSDGAYQPPKTLSILQAIESLKPICIIDEPHLLKGEKFYQAFSGFNTLHFRFGATFPKEAAHKLSNLVYCLDSIAAFRQFLVKQIHVHTQGTHSPSPELISVDTKGKKATFEYSKGGITQQKDVFYGEDVGVSLGYEGYKGKELLRVSAKDGAILSDQTTLPPHKNHYRLEKDQIRELLATSIDLHFAKEQYLFAQNIKALSLFFIPNIDDFRGESPYIKEQFEELYKAKRAEVLEQDLSEAYRAYLERDFDSDGQLRVHQGYFSGDGKNSEEREAYGVALILREKEKLLRLDEPLRFVFSVWALQEGWDNPNIFTLTKLASSASEISRHQQVGRGLRLCVDNDLRRITHSYLGKHTHKFFDINYLDVVISAKERAFIESLQKEIQDSSFGFNGVVFSQEMLKNWGLDNLQSVKFIAKLDDMMCIKPTQDGKYTLAPPPPYMRAYQSRWGIQGDFRRAV